MSNFKLIVALTAMAVIPSATATAGNFVDGGQPKLKVQKAQLAIKSPDNVACPAPAKMSGWIFTNKPGTLHYMIARKGGSVSGPFEIKSVKGANGLNVASFNREFPVHSSINAEYRILIGQKYKKTLSNWAPLNVSC
ncbi:MAG: hypothetical protein AAGA76_07270 [Pseudomonadota bacterium]